MKYPKVSIIILNFNGVKDTIECIESLKKITYPDYEIIVVDNKSAGNDVNILKEWFSNIHVIANDKNYGYAEGNNIGIRYSIKNQNPEYILILNNDTVVAKDFLEELVKVAESDENISTVSSLEYRYETNKLTIPEKKPNLWTWEGKPVDIRKADDKLECFHMEFVMLVKTEVFKKIGLYDSRLFFGADGYDWWYRNKNAGYKIVCALKSKIWHKASPTSSKFPEVRLYHSIRGGLLVEKKHGNFFQFTFFILYYLIVKFGYLCKTIIIGEYCNTGRTKSYLLKRLIRGIIDGLLINKK
ncbi:MAG: glycosyltransferase family 2 protein [Nanoarchaeota archaeon]|nr:glycosyltransferase family 2 protein [Nanoarchaeota archaeon]MCG2718058.1 glycosyltransferase family 2 protein [Nanoarchaeota archaeon]